MSRTWAECTFQVRTPAHFSIASAHDTSLRWKSASPAIVICARTPARYVHVWREDGGDPERSLDTLARAAAASARGLAALGVPPHEHAYHVFFELFEPLPGRKLGWAMEHGRSFHAVDMGDVDSLSAHIQHT